MTRNCFGLIGLGKMGRHFALNAMEHGRDVVAFDLDATVRLQWAEHTQSQPIESLEQLVCSLPSPKVMILMISAGNHIDHVIQSLLPLFKQGDCLVDAGHSYFQDTTRRYTELKSRGISFIGLGISGGIEGARHGPAMMAGGERDSVEYLWSILGPLAASHGGRLSQDWFGHGGAGHFVKMVHNGIEYADMQLLTESVYLLRYGCGMPMKEVGHLLSTWNTELLSSYLLRISAEIAGTSDDNDEHSPLVDKIVDIAQHNGTGHWMVAAALESGIAVPTISAAVEARFLSANPRNSHLLRSILDRKASNALQISPETIKNGLLVARLCVLAQGFSFLAIGGRHYTWDFNLGSVAENWQAGCIIQSQLLSIIQQIFSESPRCLNLLWAEEIVALLRSTSKSLGAMVAAASMAGIPAPAFSSALAYLLGHSHERIGADFIQLQRDYFGGHGFRKRGSEKMCHGPWSNECL
jgi:6-phosphogluconate dehydrogenase